MNYGDDHFGIMTSEEESDGDRYQAGVSILLASTKALLDGTVDPYTDDELRVTHTYLTEGEIRW